MWLDSRLNPLNSQAILQVLNWIIPMNFNYALLQKYLRYIFNVVIFISAVATILGVIFGYKQLLLANKQLDELNEKAIINVTVNTLNPTSSVRTGNSNYLTFNVIPKNVGGTDTEYWKIHIMFCNGVSVLENNPKWVKSNFGFTFSSKDVLLHDQAIFNDKIDSVGIFKIKFPISSTTLPASIPLFAIQTSGQKTTPTGYMVSLNIDGGLNAKFEYSDFKNVFSTKCIEYAS